MLAQAAEQRFDTANGIPINKRLELLSDNGGTLAAHETHTVGRSLGLKFSNITACSPQSNVHDRERLQHSQRDYISRMDLCGALAVLAQLAQEFGHFNEIIHIQV